MEMAEKEIKVLKTKHNVRAKYIMAYDILYFGDKSADMSLYNIMITTNNKENMRLIWADWTLVSIWVWSLNWL